MVQYPLPSLFPSKKYSYSMLSFDPHGAVSADREKMRGAKTVRAGGRLRGDPRFSAFTYNDSSRDSGASRV